MFAFVMCGCLGFCNVWVCVCVVLCMCVFCNVCVCVYVFATCVLVPHFIQRRTGPIDIRLRTNGPVPVRCGHLTAQYTLVKSRGLELKPY